MPATVAIPQSEWPKSLVDQAPKITAFCANDINDKEKGMLDLATVPQIGGEGKASLEAAGIKTVKQLVGMFLVKETKAAFQEWLEGVGLAAGPNNYAAKVAIVINNYCASICL